MNKPAVHFYLYYYRYTNANANVRISRRKCDWNEILTQVPKNSNNLVPIAPLLPIIAPNNGQLTNPPLSFFLRDVRTFSFQNPKFEHGENFMCLMFLPNSDNGASQNFEHMALTRQTNWNWVRVFRIHILIRVVLKKRRFFFSAVPKQFGTVLE